ncbi:unnamed protein product [Effrenium voratum]|nr:unnamed protein product [Effrenium voratum]
MSQCSSRTRVTHPSVSAGAESAPFPRARMEWLPVAAALSPDEAAKLRQDTEAELMDNGFAEKVANAMRTGEPRYDGEAYLLLGPSAAGKTTLLPQLEVPLGALVIDGSFIRQESQSWQKAIALARSLKLAGFSDYFEAYFKQPMDKVKSRIVEEAIRKRTNLIIPDSASKFSATQAMIQKLLASGYRMKFAAVFGEEEELLRRGKARASEEGKQFTGKNWKASVQAILDLEAYLESSGIIKDSGSIAVMDNTHTLKPMSHSELQKHLR